MKHYNLPNPANKSEETNSRNAAKPKLWRTIMSLSSRRVGVTICITLMAVMVVLVGCKKTPSYQTFASPDEAGDGLLQAAKSGDQNQVLAVFGPQAKNVIFSGDATQDKASIDAYVQAYGTMHRWRKMPDGAQLLLVGADNFAFPIPLRKTSDGKWFFDAGAGEEEIVRRRIGRNELAVIDVCYAIADAQSEYYSQPRNGESTQQFAAKFISDPGKQNGLYWESAQGQPPSPLGPLVAFATGEGYNVKPNEHVPFHGYYFKMLSNQGSNAPGGAKDYLVNGKMAGGFAFVAYPSNYGNSGVMTFIINQDAVLLQKDLGKTTIQTAEAMTAFDPDKSWSVVTE
ncbi:MAG: DUF2950 domain-containing protein [Acidobacteriaceae bacterium]|jgi:hypothetical protein